MDTEKIESSEQKEPKDFKEITRLSPEALGKFVDDFVSGRIYSNAHGDDALDSFLILKLGGLASCSEAYVRSIGLVYEYLREAGPLAVNGRPTFLSCQLLHREDWDLAIPVIKAEMERRKNIFVKPTGV